LNCRDALRLLYDVIDNEADEAEVARVREHIKTCRKCAARYNLEQKFKKCIEEKAKFSPECEELRNKINQHLDAIDQGGGVIDQFPSLFD
jgi:mycothiol system anti-sigma-R factor